MLRTNCLEEKTEEGRRCQQTPAGGGWVGMEHPIASSQIALWTASTVERGAEQRQPVFTRHYHKPASSTWKDADKLQQTPVVPSQWNLRANLWVMRGFPQRFILGSNLIKDCNQKQDGGHNLLMIPNQEEFCQFRREVGLHAVITRWPWGLN